MSLTSLQLQAQRFEQVVGLGGKPVRVGIADHVDTTVGQVKGKGCWRISQELAENILGNDLLRSLGLIVDQCNGVLWQASEGLGPDNWMAAETLRIYSIKSPGHYNLPELLATKDEQLADILWNNVEAFATHRNDCGNLQGMTASFTADHPKMIKQYPVPDASHASIKETVEALLEQGVLRKCNSTVNSAIWPVGKPDGSWRLTIDYRPLNSAVSCPYPTVASTPELFAKLEKKYQVYSSLDISNGFWSIRLEEECQYLFAFTFDTQQYTWTRLPQGFHASPGIFHQALYNGLASCKTAIESQGCKLLQYVDDILLMSEDRDHHLRSLAILLQGLKDLGVKINPKKSHFCKDQVQYLGVNVGADTRSLTDARSQLIRTLDIPLTVQGLRSALGLFNFCRAWIPEFSRKTQSLYDMLKGDCKSTDKLKWTEDNLNKFKLLKDEVASACVLGLPDPTLPFRHLIGIRQGHFLCSLVQKDDNGMWHVLGFYSRKMTPVESNLGICEQYAECAAWAISACNLVSGFGRKIIVTSHSPVKFILQTTPNVSNQRLARWHRILTQEDITIETDASIQGWFVPEPYEGEQHQCRPHDDTITWRVSTRAMPTGEKWWIDGSRYWDHDKGGYVTGWAALREDKKNQLGGALEGHVSAQVAELVALREALRLQRPLTLYTDSTYVLGICTKYLAVWKRRGMVNADGSQISNQNILQEIWQLIEHDSTQTLGIVKVKAHTQRKCSTHEQQLNNDVDQLAKQYAKEEPNMSVIAPLQVYPLWIGLVPSKELKLWENLQHHITKVDLPDFQKQLAEIMPQQDISHCTLAYFDKPSPEATKYHDKIKPYLGKGQQLTLCDTYIGKEGAAILGQLRPDMQALHQAEGEVHVSLGTRAGHCPQELGTMLTNLLKSTQERIWQDPPVFKLHDETGKVQGYVIKTTLGMKTWIMNDHLVTQSEQTEGRAKLSSTEGYALAQQYHHLYGHPSEESLRKVLTKRFVWEDMGQHCKEITNTCLTCAKYKVLRAGPPMGVGRLAEGPCQKLQVDHVGPLGPGTHGYRYLTTMVDLYTGWFWAKPCRGPTTGATIAALEEHISIWGVPYSIQSDNGTAFTSKAMQEWANTYGIEWKVGAIYHPQSQGKVERKHRLLKDRLKRATHEGKNWVQALPSILLFINSMHPRDQFSAYELMTGRVPHLGGYHPHPLETAKEEEVRIFLRATHDCMQNKKWEEQLEKVTKAEAHSHWTQRSPNLEPGCIVLVRKFTGDAFSPKWEGPYVITETTKYAAKVQAMSDKVTQHSGWIHRTHLVLFPSQNKRWADPGNPGNQPDEDCTGKKGTVSTADMSPTTSTTRDRGINMGTEQTHRRRSPRFQRGSDSPSGGQ